MLNHSYVLTLCRLLLVETSKPRQNSHTITTTQSLSLVQFICSIDIKLQEVSENWF